MNDLTIIIIVLCWMIVSICALIPFWLPYVIFYLENKNVKNRELRK